jgi:hypothetical protein
MMQFWGDIFELWLDSKSMDLETIVTKANSQLICLEFTWKGHLSFILFCVGFLLDCLSP